MRCCFEGDWWVLYCFIRLLFHLFLLYYLLILCKLHKENMIRVNMLLSEKGFWELKMQLLSFLLFLLCHSLISALVCSVWNYRTLQVCLQSCLDLETVRTVVPVQEPQNVLLPSHFNYSPFLTVSVSYRWFLGEWSPWHPSCVLP